MGNANPITASAPQLPPALPNFEHIRRTWDVDLGLPVAKLLPGDYYVTRYNEAIFTVLGSCVSACVRERKLGIGGMNHFMLPVDRSEGTSAWGNTASASTRFGNVAMERLINEILKLGGRRADLEVKLVGGGRVLDSLSDVGARNIRFVKEYVQAEGFRVVGADLGSLYPRKVLYDPATGSAQVKRLARSDGRVVADETRYMRDIDATPVGGDIELF